MFTTADSDMIIIVALLHYEVELCFIFKKYLFISLRKLLMGHKFTQFNFNPFFVKQAAFPAVQECHVSVGTLKI